MSNSECRAVNDDRMDRITARLSWVTALELVREEEVWKRACRSGRVGFQILSGEKAAKAGAERKDPRDGVRDSDVKLSADVCKLSTADRR